MLAENVKKYRAKLGLSQEELAHKAGVTYSTLTKIEMGVNQNPKVKTLQQIATALEVELIELFRFHHEETNPAKLRKVLIDIINHSGKDPEKLQLLLKIANAIK